MNKWLKGNGYWCQTCDGTGVGEITDVLEYEGGAFAAFRSSCPICKGSKRLAATETEIMNDNVPKTAAPGEQSCFINLIQYGRLTKTGRLPRAVTSQNAQIIARIKGMPAQPATPESDADLRNPNL